jgi:hypothetical protein
MSLALLTALFVAINLVVLLLQALCLWLGARWCAVAKTTYRWSILICGVSFVLCMVLSIGAAVGGAIAEERVGPGAAAWAKWGAWALGQSLVLLLAQVLIAWICTKIFLQIDWIAAALAAIIMTVAFWLCMLPMTYSMQAALVEKFRNPWDFMAPTIAGAHHTVTCENCGLRYPFAMPERLGVRRSQRSAKVTVCPNCGQESQVSAGADVCLGDRLLIDRTSPPRRWDPVLLPIRKRTP